MIFSVTSFSGFVLSKCLQPSFVVSHLLSWLTRARLMMQSTQMCPIRHHKNFLQTLVLLMVLFPTSTEWVLAPQVQWERDSRPSSQEHFLRLASIPVLVQGFTRFENSVLSLSQSVATITNKISSVEQVVGGLPARVAALEASAASASSVSGSAGSWPLPRQVDGSTATGSQDPGSCEEGRNTRRRLDKFSGPDDGNARCAVLLRFLCEQCHAGVSAWLKKTVATDDMPPRIHCQTGTTSARLVFNMRAKCQKFVARCRDHGLSCSVDSPFCNTSATILVRHSKSPEDREIGRRFAPLWEVHKNISVNMIPKAISSIQPLISGHKSSTYTLAETELENQFFGFTLGKIKDSMSLLLVCASLVSLMRCCVNLQVKQAIRLRIARQLCLFAAWRVEAFFCGVPFWWHLQVAFYLFQTPVLS